MSVHIVLVDQDYNSDNSGTYKGMVVNFNLKEVNREFSGDVMVDARKTGEYLKSVGVWDWCYSSSVDDYLGDNNIEYELTLRELVESPFTEAIAMNAENLVGATFLGCFDYSEDGKTEQAMLFEKDGQKYTVFACADDDDTDAYFHIQPGHITGVSN